MIKYINQYKAEHKKVHIVILIYQERNFFLKLNLILKLKSLLFARTINIIQINLKDQVIVSANNVNKIIILCTFKHP